MKKNQQFSGNDSSKGDHSNTHRSSSHLNDALGGNSSSNLWESILTDLTLRLKDLDTKEESHLLLLGDRGAGKHSVTQALNKHFIKATNKFIEVDKMGSTYAAVDFQFLYVKDLGEREALQTVVTSDENLPKMNVWVLQDQEKGDLLKQVIKADDLQNTCAIIVLDFDQPWEMMNALTRWLSVLSESVLDLMKTLPLATQDKMKERVSQYIKNYERKDGTSSAEKNGEGNTESPSKKKSAEELQDEDEDLYDLKSKLPLPEGVLKVNLGIPIIVLCHKVDLLARGDKSQYLEQNLDFLQKHLRSTCLSYAATFMFTEVQQ